MSWILLALLCGLAGFCWSLMNRVEALENVITRHSQRLNGLEIRESGRK